MSTEHLSVLALLFAGPVAGERSTRTTAADVAEKLAGLPAHAPVLLCVPGWDGPTEHPLACGLWDGALVLTATRPAPAQSEALFPATTDPDDDVAPGRGVVEAGMTVGELRDLLTAMPDYTAVLLAVSGWDGHAELPVTQADWTADGVLLLGTDYPHCGLYWPGDAAA
ncbi:hypothetical protein [Kitasatospora sp. NPDC057223]|uniref:hypothetical protein n=1 Tax=Kitasatospora sp. NPDC057223 TaxID=3346055 RepID=UPI003630DD2F